ncbi:MAG: UbiA-like protein EboC [Bacteroidota bacterium]
MRIPPFLRLMRPANIVTALADILAGGAVAGAWALGASFDNGLFWLLLSTVGLYGGGVVFNDVFDVALDREDRPERPLPSGQISLATAILGGGLLLWMGIVAAGFVSGVSALIALVVALLALGYDKYGKHHQVFGPLMMGGCRGGNLLLGMSIVVPTLTEYWYLAIIPVLFIADITLTSQGEVSGQNRPALRLALALDALVAAILILVSFFAPYGLFAAIPFILLWWWMNTAAKWKAIHNNQPALIMKAVKMGVLSLIPLNAALVAGFASWPSAIIVLSLLPLSLGLARLFSVT